MALAALTDLSYSYPGAVTPAIRHASLEIGEGLTIVAGSSGGGKSTLLRVFNGLVPHFHGGRISGSAVVMGHDVITTPTRALARDVGFVFQDPELQTVYSTVDREVAFGLENLAVPARELRARVDEALADAGVEHLAGRAVRTLSGGERQRVALASALALKPRLVVLDEPTSQLDLDGAALLLGAVSRLVHEGRAALISEHRLAALVPRARALITVEGGIVEHVEPSAWQPPAGPRLAPRSTAPGSVGWTLHEVTAGFGARVVLDGVNLSGRFGEVVVLNGPNGGGKTTLLRLIAGSLAPFAGRVERLHGRIAYLPQNPAALLHLPTLRDEVRLTLDRSGEAEGPETILERLGLLPVAGAYPRDLSSGERQRAALAAILPGRPALALLDEPTRGMDVASRDALIGLVARLRDAGVAIVIATHDQELAAAVADRVVTVGRKGVAPQPASATA